MTVWHWQNHARWYDEGLKDTLNEIKRAGFSHINWNPDSGSSYWYAKSEIEFIRNCIEEADLKVKTIHASNGVNPATEKPFLVGESRKDIHSPNKWQREAAVELLQNRIDLAKALSCSNVVLHVDVRDQFHDSPQAESDFYDPLHAMFSAVRPYCLDAGVQIAVENLTHASADTFLSMFDRLFSRYEEGFMGLCYDSGHWEMIETGRVRILEQFGDRLITTHLHDNCSARDDHLLPFDGRIDWDLVTTAIAKTPYEPPLNLETPKDMYQVSDRSFYNQAFIAASKLESMVSKARADTNA